ncbi:hypothetical protein PRIPAC_74385 [Pristionchus pacificus]|uniref:Uncharacterized protein n=1 Tax=Pristionchus pacificus TaxID=54126 RepID=A0A2A6C9C0_PRIPA|nr:hypothetical protein PRIPAC_74385 [Pristionchus pacificus]|eukprot:PDM74653.1 hypothetical protein PRIPAC_42009 [Pristionchus pacificus]
MNFPDGHVQLFETQLSCAWWGTQKMPDSGACISTSLLGCLVTFVLNRVGFTHTFFVLFLMYLVTWMIWNVVGGLQAIIVYFCTGYDRLDMIIPLCCLWVLQTASSIWPLGELLRYHWLLISLNETTCEQAKIPNIRGDPKANYDVGRWKNIEIVFGWGLWLFPVRTTTTDGLHHPINYVEPAADAAQFRVTGTAESDPTRSPTATTPLPCTRAEIFAVKVGAPEYRPGVGSPRMIYVQWDFGDMPRVAEGELV